MKTFAILLVAGKSTRFENNVSKQVFLLKGKPVFSYPLLALAKSKVIDEIIVVSDGENEVKILDFINENKLNNVHLCLGGATRQLSVEEGLKCINADPDDIVLIHDGARPLLDEEVIERTVEAANSAGAVTTFLPMEDTVAFSDFEEHIAGFADRTNLVKIQTPQAFKYAVISEAHKLATDTQATDDCSLVMRTLMQVKLVPGSKKLAKLTTIEDVNYLETFIK
ncbi:MAG: 2-C-methyl-D-erythritol 4-phosphate cytidylyltransferase [Bacilli bacterium]|nr:2-C-methyl-D-erythritol 4-phosphate cytidylyltransferase [Bacilli bacterium]